MKSYTNLEQSKKLIDILPIESADYTRLGKNEDNVLTRPYVESCSSELRVWLGEDILYPCWSLTALLGILPDELEEGYCLTLNKEGKKYCCCYEDNNGDSFKHTFANNPIDACYEIILKLNELKML